MSDLPLVSIVTPSLNRAALLEKVLLCVREQTYGNIQHIVVDGGSTDATVSLLEDYSQRFHIDWVSEPDTGIYNAVNKGFGRASGEIFAYLNTDDLYFPHSVACAVEAFGRDPKVGFVYGDMVAIDEGRGRGAVVFHPRFDEGSLRRGRIIGQPAVFWRRSVFESLGGFDETLSLAADHDYWRRIAVSFPGARIDEVLAYEGVHAARLTSGPEAVHLALEELETVRLRYDPDAAVRQRRLAWDLWDRLVAAYWYRVLTLRLLYCSLFRPKSPPGASWAGFLMDERFRIRRKEAFLCLIPFLGRAFKRSFVESL